MKAITLNLLVEEQLAQKAKARDPVKVTIVIGIVLITVAVIAGSWLAGISQKRKAEADSLQAKCDALVSKQVDPDGLDTKTLQSMSEEYVTISKSRYLFAPNLAVIKDMIPPTIQINNIRLALVADAPVGGTVKEQSKVKVVERVMFQLDGRAICPRAEIAVDQFIQSIQTNDLSRNVIADVKLRSINHSGGEGPIGAIQTAAFVIDCTFKGKDQP